MSKILSVDSVTFTYRVGSIERATSDTGFLFRGMQKACNSLTQQDALWDELRCRLGKQLSNNNACRVRGMEAAEGARHR